MKKLFKWVFRLLLVLVLLILALIAFLDPIAKHLAQRQIRKETGLEVKIGSLSIGLRTPTITVENFKLLNSPEFGDSTFIDIPLARLEYNLEALRSKKIHLSRVRFNLGELHIVQNKDGKTNLQSLREREQKNASSASPGGAKAEFDGIDTLVLTIGKLKFTSEKNPTNNTEIYVGLKNETVKNVKSAADLQPLFTRIALERGATFLSENLFSRGTNLLENAVQPAGKEAQKALDSVNDQLKKQ